MPVRNLFFLWVFMLLLLAVPVINVPCSAVGTGQPNQREAAVDWFHTGEYERALPVFAQLSYDYPYDYLLKYFTGACLVETGNYGLEAEKNLLLASSKDVPAKVYYFLGKLYHANNNWNSAQRYYNRFRNNTDSAQVKELGIEELSQLCYSHINPFTVLPANQASERPGKVQVGTEPEQVQIPVINLAEPVASDGKVSGVNTPDAKEVAGTSKPENSGKKDSLETTPGKKNTEVSGTEIPSVDKESTVPPVVVSPGVMPEKVTVPDLPAPSGVWEVQTDGGEKPVTVVTEPLRGGDPVPDTSTTLPGAEIVPAAEIPAALRTENVTKPTVGRNGTDPGTLQQSAGKEYIDFPVNSRITYQLREMFQEKEALAAFDSGREKERRLDSLLQLTCRLRKEFQEQRNLRLRDELAQKIRDLEQANVSLKMDVNDDFLRARQTEEAWWKDTDYSVMEKFMQISDSIREIRFPPLPEPEEMPPLPADTIKEMSPDTLSKEEVQLPENKAQDTKPGSGEVVYKIQLGAYSQGIPDQKKEIFDKISKIRIVETHKDEKGNTVYTTGNLKNFADAVKLQGQVRQEGITDAFVIAMQNGKRIPLP